MPMDTWVFGKSTANSNRIQGSTFSCSQHPVFYETLDHHHADAKKVTVLHHGCSWLPASSSSKRNPSSVFYLMTERNFWQQWSKRMKGKSMFNFKSQLPPAPSPTFFFFFFNFYLSGDFTLLGNDGKGKLAIVVFWKTEKRFKKSCFCFLWVACSSSIYFVINYCPSNLKPSKKKSSTDFFITCVLSSLN